ncbi:MAG: 1,2-phenylacetyl-CoA epoxidase subunit PaaC [Roseateles asaccharophilus]|jgi:ring-1,2-phenylacetyl-CoA epoxidase subunit PaaC|uniref:Ring-1,2-phenylacetyl-CoA epoxidase subunit PaaC n=1 Tax=Roseateles asaccharophilus TaxID=582607 RepID=A0A4R6MZZ2_9BURK|nr:1,2-phenylacetyl-CoA epoxidase subunit PaaC [Roseateles asaccharophilus]MDN3545501.1 1,2-phenylacetyl-CoA epoxidase subunit PaaC [Roseateles asaccharophilus]TDP07881.1 ring-1,2-phenylacetyl-CoA epoxidase subunit PaaC [Roseateles asaccharophilus]
MSQQSIQVGESPQVQYLLRLGDSCLVLAQRICEWSGHAPILEEDLALSNMALDLLGQARALLTHAARLDGQGHDEDQLAFLRDERQYLNPVLMELPRGDFAFTVLRNFAVSTWLLLLWRRLEGSSDAELAAIAGKAVKEAAYHQQHAADWVLRLGDGTEESSARMRAALGTLWPYCNELFDSDAVDAAAAAQGLGPDWASLKDEWRAQFCEVLADAGLDCPKDSAYQSQGRRGIHSEHLGHMLATMQYLQRAYPGGVW